MDPRYEPIGGVGKFIKWDTPGEVAEGIWKGQGKGKFGPVGIIETDEGPAQFSLTTVLEDRLKDIAIGRQICIEYVGKARSKAGVEFKSFNVGAWPEGEAPPAPAKAEDDVPF